MAVERTSAVRERSFWRSPKWVRARSNGSTLVDTRRAVLVWEPERSVPIYAVPRDDVAPEALERAIEYSDPELADYVSFPRDSGLTWLDEDDEAPGHPRDPFHRIDVHQSSRHVRISIDGKTVAESSRPVLLFETGLPMRIYLDPEDVRMDLLTATETRTLCPYKGYASYWTARAGGADHADIAWTYVDPLPDVAPIAGRIAFFDEKVDVEIDGEPSARPKTPWS
jgi:uncharacterized protein (DUF427 family)